jgi:hypothetical protein
MTDDALVTTDAVENWAEAIRNGVVGERSFTQCAEATDALTALTSTCLSLVERVQRAEKDSARLAWLEGVLRPLPWGGVYAVIESDGESHFRFTVQPVSGDAPFINSIDETVEGAIDAARQGAK